jgi:CheY-like chemotaxis protein
MSPRPPRVFVIEDNPDNMQILVRILTRVGYEVIPARDGEEAIRTFKAQLPDLILADLAMPGVSGVEVIRVIKSDPETQHIPVVVVSGHMREGQVGESLRQVDVEGFILKPFKADQLLREVSKHMPSRHAVES